MHISTAKDSKVNSKSHLGENRDASDRSENSQTQTLLSRAQHRVHALELQQQIIFKHKRWRGSRLELWTLKFALQLSKRLSLLCSAGLWDQPTAENNAKLQGSPKFKSTGGYNFRLAQFQKEQLNQWKVERMHELIYFSWTLTETPDR